LTGERVEPVTTTVPPSRSVVLDGCVNFRDLGGYRTADGHQTRWRRLFRADGLNKLSQDDRARLRDMGLATVIDLRTVDEGEQRGSFPVDEVPVRYHSLPLADVLPTPEEFAAWQEASYVASHYFELVVGRGAVLAQAINLLAESDALPAVVHCSAGKDRTGVLSALILAFLGVPDETIVEDYTLSAPAMVLLFERLKGEYPDSVEIVTKLSPALIQVAPETMANLLDALRAEYGSYDRLAEHLGVSEAVDRLRPILLEVV
jgi:protein-tyrosine phosphatase